MVFSDIPFNIHFVGIGGVGMSALAQHFARLGYNVTGSDLQRNEYTCLCERCGITVNIGHNERNVQGAELVVHTSAVKTDNVELQYAVKNNIPIVLREQLLGTVVDSFSQSVAVCGTHGKTTVTAMISHVLRELSVPHTAIIGGTYNGYNYFGNGNGIVVAEACEYNRSFFNLHPSFVVCTNVEYDHPDCYSGLDDVRQAFAQFCGSATSGVFVRNADSNYLPDAVIYDKFVTVSNVSCNNGKYGFTVDVDGTTSQVNLQIVGKHNVDNALAVIAFCVKYGLSLSKVCKALSAFTGVDRRWTEHKVDGYTVICDYAHHPTEISCAVHSALSVTKGKVICVFQPHTYTRTKAYFNDFVRCFDGASNVCYLPIYSAREKPIYNVSSQSLTEYANKQGLHYVYRDNFEDAYLYVLSIVKPNDTVLILGAGDVVKVMQYFK